MQHGHERTSEHHRRTKRATLSAGHTVTAQRSSATESRSGWRRNWTRSASTADTRAQAGRHAHALRDALKRGVLEDANQHFVAMHRLSQNSFRLHARSHWLRAKVHRRERQWAAAAAQTYLGLMAPYGTLRRRLEGCQLDDPNPTPVLAFFRTWQP